MRSHLLKESVKSWTLYHFGVMSHLPFEFKLKKIAIDAFFKEIAILT